VYLRVWFVLDIKKSDTLYKINWLVLYNREGECLLCGTAEI